MNKVKYLGLAAVGGIFLLMGAPKLDVQVAISVGPAPDCPYGYYDTAPYACAPYGTLGRNGLRAEFSLALARGFMSINTSGAT